MDLLKIDIEESEIAALEDASDLYNKDLISVTQIEYNPTWIKAKKLIEDLLEFADQFNLNLFGLTSKRIISLNKYHHSLDDFNYKIF